MPLDTSPRSLPLGDVHAAGQMGIVQRHGHEIANVTYLSAPVTIWMGASPPTSTWQMFRWSELGWLDDFHELADDDVADLRAAVLIALHLPCRSWSCGRTNSSTDRSILTYSFKPLISGT